jgi:predicted ATPase
MIKSIQIENFRSLRDVTLNLQRVNLLIGPNNAGKSNFFKALKFLINKQAPTTETFLAERYRALTLPNIVFKVEYVANSGLKQVLKGTKSIESTQNQFSFFKIENDINKILSDIPNLPIYSIDISKVNKPALAKPNIYTINDDCSNIVSFLDNMYDEQNDVIEKIENDITRCIKEFRKIVFKKVEIAGETHKKIGLKTKTGQNFWAEELSDGTLYFLALLCIIHQPEPPKVLLLEEPENGIHPRRIKEIMDFIFDLAEEKDIQVIITTHSTYVIDQFKDIPESIFVFDKDGDETKIRNLQDIITDDIQKSTQDGLPPMDLSGSLGDHWASGLIGGVPR